MRQCSRDILDKWSGDADLKGAYLVTLIDPKTLEVEVRQTGKVTKFSPAQFRKALKLASKTEEGGWACAPKGLGYSVRYEGTLVGVCIIFPQSGTTPRQRWSDQAADYALKVGPLLVRRPKPSPRSKPETTRKSTPTLSSLAKTIPQEAPKPRKVIDDKLHWEKSATRVEVPVPEELAVHLILDYGPLF